MARPAQRLQIEHGGGQMADLTTVLLPTLRAIESALRYTRGPITAVPIEQHAALQPPHLLGQHLEIGVYEACAPGGAIAVGVLCTMSLPMPTCTVTGTPRP